jgi:uncharacterized membrane protein YfcA
VHVLTGPDHLSALATLSANVQNIEHAAWLGIRWGIGHSTGLLLVAIILLLFFNHPTDDDDTIDVPKYVSTFFETLVGIFLIFLGVYGIHRARVKRFESTYGDIPSVSDLVVEQQQQQRLNTLHHHHVYNDIPISVIQVERDGTDIEMLRPQNNESIISSQQPQQQLQEVKEEEQPEPTSRFKAAAVWVSKLSTRTMAILAGILHGLAGPGGVLGVIPAIQLQNGKLAALYLFCFCTTSTITMGIFAAMYGSFSSSLTMEQQPEGGNCRPFLTDCNLPSPRIREFQIECASAGLSILVGVLWLVLLALGKLDAIFP